MKFKLFILGALLSSCSDDFLTKVPETVVSAADFYKTESDFQQAIVGLYNPLRTLYGTGLADAGAWSMGEMRSDNTTFSFNAGNRGYADREYVDLFTDDANSGATSNKYNNNYIIIGRANQVLRTIDAAAFDETQKNNFKGQALFLRAFCYFDLVQYYGDVPLALIPPTSFEQTSLPRSPKADVYKQIIADATLAASLLPDPSKQIKGYVANGAAYALLGNVHLVLKQWTEAENALTKVQGYSLMSDYAAVFDPNNKNNVESIFEVQYLDEPTAGSASNFAYNFLPILADPGVIPGFPSGNTNSYAGWNTPTPDLINIYDQSDKRKAASIGFYNGEGYTNRPYIKKFTHGAKIAPNTNDNWPVYRYAEVLLMLAEAQNEQGKATALANLNAVHAHSRTGLAPIASTGQAELRELILKERQIELAFENKRWLDLVRSGKAVAIMNAQGAKIRANPEAYYYPKGISPVSGSYTVTESKLLFPIPQRELRLNPDIEQNPGY
ncbi:RagB/SusD family nutrient uptake outer membrane protein [Dyadobacter sp. CY312]|uniref:RagB/SusD family nutrient uptake outer membrane protein n=1 Tax=Dyadobacter sp. CY312 TaxID=2907303 RepID=UPI001F223B7E|nr:RagB/SusD family nutrient uptake outer membrane protein [Dyadobacter sp. CY312]MCE7043779.1 RagB/SusD family nutrient uptake outer membrane protein [Dyadobacter sp. CY312]